MTTSTTAVKSQGTTLFAAAAVASALYTESAAVDVSTKLGPAVVSVSVGRTVTTALTNEIGFRIQGAFKAASDDSQWFDIFAWTTAALKTASSANTTTSGTNAAAQNVLVLAAGTGSNAGDIGFCNESGKYEWFRVESVSSATLTLQDVMNFAHSTGAGYFDGNERFAIPIDLSPWTRIRLSIDTAASGGTAAAASGQTVVVEAFLNTMDSVLNT